METRIIGDNMKIEKKKLLEILDALKPGLSNKDIIEFSDSISFVKGALITYNDFIAVQHPLEDSKIKGTVKADKLYAHIKKVKTDEKGMIKIKATDDDLLIKTKASKAGIPIIPGAAISLEELGKEITKWRKLPKDFIEGIRMSIFSAGTDASEPKLTCLHVAGNIVEATNGHRAFRYKMEGKINKEFLVPATSAPAVLNHPIEKYAVTKNWTHFKTKAGVIISTRMYADVSFPDCGFLFDIKGAKVKFPDGLRDVIDRAIDFIGEEDEDKNIKIHMLNDLTKISSKSIQGWFRETIREKSKTEVAFDIDPQFLQDILRTSQSAKINREAGLLKFESDKWEHTINVVVE